MCFWTPIRVRRVRCECDRYVSRYRVVAEAGEIVRILVGVWMCDRATVAKNEHSVWKGNIRTEIQEYRERLSPVMSIAWPECFEQSAPVSSMKNSC